MAPLDEIQQAAQAQFAARSQSYGASHILADVSDVAAALEKISLPSQARAPSFPSCTWERTSPGSSTSQTRTRSSPRRVPSTPTPLVPKLHLGMPLSPAAVLPRCEMHNQRRTPKTPLPTGPRTSPRRTTFAHPFVAPEERPKLAGGDNHRNPASQRSRPGRGAATLRAHT
jgi:hypothetical protein